MIENFTNRVSIVAILVCLGCFGLQAQNDNFYNDLPPQAAGDFGKCYAKCKIPAQFENVTTKVLVKEASVNKTVIPGTYTTVDETILVKEASKKLIPVAAKYDNVQETVMVKEASYSERTIPAKYETVTDRMLVAPAYGKWVKKKKAPNCFSANPEDCYVACWEEVPAQYKTVTKKVLVSPAEVIREEIPAEYKTITKRVLVQPATVQEVEIPAEYKTVTKRVMASAPTVTEDVVPAEYKDIVERKLISAEAYGQWVEILCEAKTSTNKVQDIQRALRDAGFDPGPIDGVMGSQTKAALEAYQMDKGLPIGNLNLETLSALGISH